MKPGNINLKALSYAVSAYMLLALLWWSILLFKKNNEAYTAKVELMSARSGSQYTDITVLKRNEKALDSLRQYHDRQTYMILGEALVFGLILILGLYLMNRAHKKEMEALNRQRNFLMSITHELKSPLASIKLTLETFRKKMLSVEEVGDISEDALDESNRLETLINNILFASKVSDTYIYNFELVDIHELINENIALHKMLNDQITITRHHNLKKPILKLDREAVISVFNNLVDNAMKYSDSPAKLDITTYESNEFAVIEFADNGIGIPKSEAANIFKQFYRIGDEETRKTQGTGLGLFITNEIMKAHNGTIDVRPNSPKGSIFIVKFPKSG